MDNEAELRAPPGRSSSRRARSRVTRPTRRFTATSSLGSPTSSRSSGRLTTRSMPAAPRSRSSGPTPLPRPAPPPPSRSPHCSPSPVDGSKPPTPTGSRWRPPSWRSTATVTREPGRARSASSALRRAGPPLPWPGSAGFREAALILDTGRTRELRRRFQASVRQSRTPTSRRPASRAGRSYM